MKRKRSFFLTVSFLIGFGAIGLAQEGQVRIQQDEIIPKLLEKKTQMVQEGRLGDRYRIQLYSGDNNEASKVIKEYRTLYPWTSTIVYETPNYKVWIGNFRNSLEADRALVEVKKTFPAAFRFKPERK
jgi:hypothetical protein